jgi:hypothetical protein
MGPLESQPGMQPRDRVLVERRHASSADDSKRRAACRKESKGKGEGQSQAKKAPSAGFVLGPAAALGSSIALCSAITPSPAIAMTADQWTKQNLSFRISSFEFRILAPALAAILVFGPFISLAVAAPDPSASPSPPPDLFGIGAALYPDGDYPVVNHVVKGGAADREGHLKANDHVTGVAEGDAPFVDCKGMDIDKVIDMTRGKEGSIVRLQVNPAGADPSKREVIRIARAELYINRLSPPQLARLDGEVGKFTEAVARELADDMRKRVAEVVQATGLDASGSNALEDAAARAAPQCLEKSKAGIRDGLEKELLADAPEQRGVTFQAMDLHMETFVEQILPLEGISPEDMPAWQDALKRILTPAQAAAWGAIVAQRKQREENAMDGYLNYVASWDTEMEMQVLAPSLAAIKTELKPSKDRVDKLEALEKSIADGVAAEGRASTRKALLGMNPIQRQNILQSRGIMNVPAFTTEKWDAALPKILSPDEIKRLADVKKARMDRRAAATGKFLVTLMDEKIALTAAQRKLLEPIAQRLVASPNNLIQDYNPNNYYNFTPSQFYAAASTAAPGEIKAILDPIQWGHWQEACALKDMPDPNESIPMQLPSAQEPSAEKPVPEPGEVERALSKFMSDKSTAERRNAVTGRLLKAEEIERIDHLPPEIADRLKTAARGEAEGYLVVWNEYADKFLRDNLNDVSPDDVHAQLDNFQPYQFVNIGYNVRQTLANGANQQKSLWDKTVKALLTKDQIKAWKQETDARTDYRRAAVAAYVVSSFDQFYAMTADQWTKLQSLVDKVIAEYGTDLQLDQDLSANGGFLSNNMVMVPIAGIPDGDLKALLSDEQWRAWRASYTCSNAMQNWNQIESMHKQAAQN